MTSRYGSDLVVDLLAEAEITHVAFNPGATFRGIHDSLVQREAGGPQVVLCLHEGIAVAAAQGYAKLAGHPMAVLLHDVVGLQNATMAIYNAWCDRVPMLLLGGSGPGSKANRRPWIDWIHSASAQAQLVRDSVKWDDEPRDAASVTESFARGRLTACAAPAGPVYLSYDVDLQEDELPDGFTAEPLGSYAAPSAPAPPADQVGEIAARLRAAESPVIVTGHVGETPGAFAAVVALAEAAGAAVVDTGVRCAFPTGHDLYATGVDRVLDEADVVLVLDADDRDGALPRTGRTVIDVGLAYTRARGWSHDYQALMPADLRVTAAADELVAALLAELPSGEAACGGEVRARLAEARRARRAEAAAAAADGAVPVPRMLHELGRALAGRRFVLANGTNERVEHALWDLDAPRSHLGWHAGGGLGYGLGAAIGAALAAEPGTVVVDVQADGDLLFTPSALWTLAEQRLPVLVVVHDNRQYGNTVEHAERIARQRGRDPARRHVGAAFADPPIDIAALARSFGVWAEGPLSSPELLAAALQRALAVVSSGRPALLDVLTPGS